MTKTVSYSNDLLQVIFMNLIPLLSKCGVFVNPDRPLRVIKDKRCIIVVGFKTLKSSRL